jgi:hypothetical protein
MLLERTAVTLVHHHHYIYLTVAALAKTCHWICGKTWTKW